MTYLCSDWNFCCFCFCFANYSFCQNRFPAEDHCNSCCLWNLSQLLSFRSMNFVGAVPCYKIGFSPLILQTFISFLYQNEGGKWVTFKVKEQYYVVTTQILGGHTLADWVQGIQVTLCICAHDDTKVLCWASFKNYSLSLWLRTTQVIIPPGSWKYLSCHFVHHFPEWLIPVNLSGVALRGLRWKWDIWLVWAQISHLLKGSIK